jgi:hypothetical protein
MNRRVGVCTAVVFGLLSSITSAHAQTTPVDTGAPPSDTPPAPPPPAVIETAPIASPPLPPPPAPPAAGPGAMKIDGTTGSSIKFGLLLQPQYQAASDPTLDSYGHNLFLRRARILIGGSLFGQIDYFFDTDFANLFLSNTVGGGAGMPGTQVKNTPGMNIQDAFATYKGLGDVLKVDVGYMLPPMSHNAVQGATSLYSWDYFAYTFQHQTAFPATASSVGRDAGVQFRGLVFGGKLEYRAGVFQGVRVAPTATDVGARNFFRLAGRLQVNLLDPETGFFYSGTYLGTKKIASVGASYDFQDNYRYWALDGFVDMPVGPGTATAQVNFAHWHGGSTVALADQAAVSAEAGFNFTQVQVSPIVRYEHLWTDAGANVNRIGGGVAFWPFGHNSNLKLFYSMIKTNGAPSGANQINLQWQVFFF